MFPCGQQDQLEDTGDPLVVKGHAASPTSPRRAVCSRNAGGFWPFQPRRVTTVGYIVFIYCGQISDQEFYLPLNSLLQLSPAIRATKQSEKDLIQHEGMGLVWGYLVEANFSS